MTTEHTILAACVADREAYETLLAHCSVSEFSPIGKHWLKQIGDYYARDREAKSADRKLLKSLGIQAAESRHAETLTAYYDDLPVVGISATNVVAEVLTHKKNHLGLKLASLLADPDSDPDTVIEKLEDYEDLLLAATRGMTRLNVLDPSTVHKMYDPDKIIPLYPVQLQRQCMGGGAMPGHHILVYGRPESGKSLFTINMAAGMAFHGKKVLYFGNEESVQTHYARMACNLAKRNIADFQDHSQDIVAEARKKGLDNVQFIDIEPGTFAEIEQGIKEFRPDAVVLDQLTGVEVGESNPVRAIDKAARSFRTLLKKHQCVGVSVAQAGDRTERHGQLPPVFLGMGDVYGSRTGLPAQCDLMIGLGYDQEMYDMDIRGVSLPKNKLGGTHNGFKVRIDIQQSKVKSLGGT